MTVWHRMTAIVVAQCDAQETEGGRKSLHRTYQLWHVLAFSSALIYLNHSTLVRKQFVILVSKG
jgi:hypothetical protein